MAMPSAMPSTVPMSHMSHTLSSGVIAAISLATIAVIAIVSTVIFWCFIRPWMKRRKALAPQAFPQDASHDGTYPWETPDSVEPKPQERHSIPYPGGHTELPTNSPRFLAVDSEKYLDEKMRHSGIENEGFSEGDPNSDSYAQSASHSRPPNRDEMSPVSPTTPGFSISSFPAPPTHTTIDRAGAVSPISSSSPTPKFKYLTPENALSSYTDDEDDDEDEDEDDDAEENIEIELEGSPSFHTRNSILRAESELKRNSSVREEPKRDSKRVELPGGGVAEQQDPDEKKHEDPDEH
jgi:hypothetical protein